MQSMYLSQRASPAALRMDCNTRAITSQLEHNSRGPEVSVLESQICNHSRPSCTENEQVSDTFRQRRNSSHPELTCAILDCGKQSVFSKSRNSIVSHVLLVIEGVRHQ